MDNVYCNNIVNPPSHLLQDTHVFISADPFDFGSAIDGTAVQVGTVTSHAPEVLRDTEGNW